MPAKPAAALACAFALLAGAASAENVTLDVSQISQHPALDAPPHGLQRGLSDAGYVDRQNLDYHLQPRHGPCATNICRMQST